MGWAKKLALGLVNFVPVLTYHFCLTLPEEFSQPGTHFLVQKAALKPLSILSSLFAGSSMKERHHRSSSERMEVFPRPRPSFLHTDSDLTVQEGQHAFLNCKIRNLYNETVSEVIGF